MINTRGLAIFLQESEQTVLWIVPMLLAAVCSAWIATSPVLSDHVGHGYDGIFA